MNGWVHWRDAVAAAERLAESDRRTLRLLSHLPFIWEGAIEQLSGARAGSPVYRCLSRLRETGLVGEIHPALRAGKNLGLLYLTDLGIATLAVDRRVDAAHLARRARLRGPDLLDRLLSLPHLLATYQLLAALAGTRGERAELLAWDQPWRGRIRLPTRKAPVTVELPAYAALSWDGRTAELILMPDLATFPLRVHRPAIGHLQARRRVSGTKLPTLVIATTDDRRSAWTRLLDDLARSHRSAPLDARIVTWRELLDDRHNLDEVAAAAGPTPAVYARDLRLRPLDERRPGSPIPRAVSSVFDCDASDNSLGRLALKVSPVERVLLDLVGRHPFLSAESLAAVLGWEARRLRERWTRLIQFGLVRLLDTHERDRSSPSDLTELTRAGLEFVAAQQGLSLARAVRFNGLAGGGPDHPTGIRRLLVRDLAHTLGA
ncbi:MAG: hypothetical protein IT305_12815, partial [Chloroflexi bacterium]|nr:hypothetical protein [Chloroflexota bacterium]